MKARAQCFSTCIAHLERRTDGCVNWMIRENETAILVARSNKGTFTATCLGRNIDRRSEEVTSEREGLVRGAHQTVMITALA